MALTVAPLVMLGQLLATLGFLPKPPLPLPAGAGANDWAKFVKIGELLLERDRDRRERAGGATAGGGTRP